MDLLQRLKDAASYGVTKEEFFRLLEMEVKLQEQKKSTEVTVDTVKHSLQWAKEVAITLEDLGKKIDQQNEMFLEMRNTVLNRLEEDKENMKRLLYQAQQEILKAVSIKLDEERKSTQNNLTHLQEDIISDISKKLEDTVRPVESRINQNHCELIAILSKKPDRKSGAIGKKGDMDTPYDGTDTQQLMQSKSFSKSRQRKEKKKVQPQLLQEQQAPLQQQQPLIYPYPGLDYASFVPQQEITKTGSFCHK